MHNVPVWPVETFRCCTCTTKKSAPCDTFFRNHKSWTNKIVYLEWALANLQNISIYYPSGKYKHSICSFSEYYCYKTVFMHNICAPLKDIWCIHDTSVHKILLALNLTIIFIKPLTCNKTTFIFLSNTLSLTFET